MERRTATFEEIRAQFTKMYGLEDYFTARKVRYRHFLCEHYNPRARNGVSHRQYSNSRVFFIDGAALVRHGGDLYPVTADFITLDDGQSFVADLRLKSEYLK